MIMPRKERILCEQCRNECERWATRFCSNSCQKEWEFRQKIGAWKRGEIVGHTGSAFQVSSIVRKYLFEKYGSKCVKCGWNKVHSLTGKIPLEVNHIDGDASNSWEDNLELLCPNCHSLTPNFRALNKNSVRIRNS